jgi:hypothetical protein
LSNSSDRHRPRAPRYPLSISHPLADGSIRTGAALVGGRRGRCVVCRRRGARRAGCAAPSIEKAVAGVGAVGGHSPPQKSSASSGRSPIATHPDRVGPTDTADGQGPCLAAHGHRQCSR